MATDEAYPSDGGTNPSGALTSVSCATDGTCVAGGYYENEQSTP
jgi:hypothetical protein